MINDDQVAVLQLQSVDTRDCPVAQLSLCPGVLETEVLGVFSLKNFVEVLIEKAEEDVVYRLTVKCYLNDIYILSIPGAETVPCSTMRN